MKKLIISSFCLILCLTTFGQDAKAYYEQGMEKAQAGNLEEAVKLLDKSIELKSNEYVAWYNRAIIKSMLTLYEEAMLDFDQTIKLAPTYKKGYLNRGTNKKRLTDYDGALSDYNYALQLDSNYSDACYNRGLIYELMSKKDMACADFNKANELGLKTAQKKVEKCSDTTTLTIYPILGLTKKADNDKYGFTSENPIKVGAGPDGGPANQRAYLNLLRDAQGKSIKFKRLGSCCMYPSKNGFAGGESAMLDTYEMTYLNDKGKEQKAVVYISFYDYEEPQILWGFKTVGQK